MQNGAGVGACHAETPDALTRPVGCAAFCHFELATLHCSVIGHQNSADFCCPTLPIDVECCAQGMSAARDGPQKWATTASRVLSAERPERVARWVGRRRPADRALCGLPRAAVVPQEKEVIRCKVINRGGCGNAVNVAAYRSPLKLTRRRPYQLPAGLFMPGPSSSRRPFAPPLIGAGPFDPDAAQVRLARTHFVWNDQYGPGQGDTTHPGSQDRVRSAF